MIRRLCNVVSIPAALATLIACQSAAAPAPEPTAAAPSPAAPVPSEAVAPAPDGMPGKHGMDAPMVLTLSGPAKVAPGATFELTAEVRRTFLSPQPLRLDVALPTGVMLVEGKTTETVVDAEHHVFARTWKVRLAGAVPSEDLTVTASWQAPTWGASAVRTYRFGRPEPRLTAPRRDGPEITLPGRAPSRGIKVGPTDGDDKEPGAVRP